MSWSYGWGGGRRYNNSISDWPAAENVCKVELLNLEVIVIIAVVVRAREKKIRPNVVTCKQHERPVKI